MEIKLKLFRGGKMKITRQKFLLKILITLQIVVITCSFYPALLLHAQDRKSVLFISSYDDTYELVPDEIQGILNVFDKENINLDTEFMDTKRFDTAENAELFYGYLKYKMENLDKYDAIIVGDDPALQFAVKYQDDIFKDIPIIFLGINDLNAATEAGNKDNITGIVQDTSLENNIQIALNINPKATGIVALVDGTLTGQGDKDQFYSIKDVFPETQFSDIDSSKYTFDEVASQLKKIDERTIVLYLNMGMDITGETKTISEMVDMITANTNVPVYRATEGGVGEGLLGGEKVSFLKMGEIAAGMAVDIFNGTPVENIDVIYDTPHEIVFDYNVIQKFGISENLLPEGSKIINKEPSFFEENKTLVTYVIIVFCALVAICFVIALDNIKRRKFQKKLEKTNDELSEAFLEISSIEEELRSQYETSQEYLKEIELLNQKYEISVKVTDSAVWELDTYTGKISISSNFGEIINQEVESEEDVEVFSKKIFGNDFYEILRKEYLFVKDGLKSEINVQLPVVTSKENKWVLVRGQGVKNQDGNIDLLYGIILDITAIKEQEKNIENLAKHDYLTSLPNRLYYVSELNNLIEKGRPCSVMILDIDNFKEINDTLGHVYGDKVLKSFAARILEDFGNENIFISRFGGDEFVLLLPEINENTEIEKFLKKYRLNQERIIKINGIDNYITFSIGISKYPYDGEDSDQLIMNADTAMYRVKNSGKKNYIFYSTDMKKELKDKTEIETFLRNALKEDGFYLAYQPQVSLTTGDIVSFEALIRLKNHKIPPNIFIKIAEETDIILEIGRYVTKEVITQISKWRDMGLEPKKVSINYSTKQLRDKDYISFLKRTLKEFRVEPQYIEIEITENILFEKNEDSLKFLDDLKKTGVSIALDDFGTGYSSINYLTYIPVDKLKLDKTLCDKFLIMENSEVINSIISLAHGLNLKITAEGIEEEIQFQRLKNAKCDYIQGYIFCKPLKSEELETIYNKNFF